MSATSLCQGAEPRAQRPDELRVGLAVPDDTKWQRCASVFVVDVEVQHQEEHGEAAGRASSCQGRRGHPGAGLLVKSVFAMWANS